MQTYSDPTRAADPHALPDVEVFYISDPDWYFWSNTAEPSKGWYYQYCFPSCLPDSDPVGPFESAEAAKQAAQEQAEDDFWSSTGSHIDPRDLS